MQTKQQLAAAPMQAQREREAILMNSPLDIEAILRVAPQRNLSLIFQTDQELPPLRLSGSKKNQYPGFSGPEEEDQS